jgi:hypothetical protein
MKRHHTNQLFTDTGLCVEYIPQYEIKEFKGDKDEQILEDVTITSVTKIDGQDEIEWPEGLESDVRDFLEGEINF